MANGQAPASCCPKNTDHAELSFEEIEMVDDLKKQIEELVQAEGITAIYGVEGHKIAKELAIENRWLYTGLDHTDEDVAGLPAGFAAGWLSIRE